MLLVTPVLFQPYLVKMSAVKTPLFKANTVLFSFLICIYLFAVPQLNTQNVPREKFGPLNVVWNQTGGYLKGFWKCKRSKTAWNSVVFQVKLVYYLPKTTKCIFEHITGFR